MLQPLRKCLIYEIRLLCAPPPPVIVGRLQWLKFHTMYSVAVSSVQNGPYLNGFSLLVCMGGEHFFQ